jgi:hypothetical protein
VHWRIDDRDDDDDDVNDLGQICEQRESKSSELERGVDAKAAVVLFPIAGVIEVLGYFNDYTRRSMIARLLLHDFDDRGDRGDRGARGARGARKHCTSCPTN